MLRTEYIDVMLGIFALTLYRCVHSQSFQAKLSRYRRDTGGAFIWLMGLVGLLSQRTATNRGDNACAQNDVAMFHGYD
jgi:hypothetical protein